MEQVGFLQKRVYASIVAKVPVFCVDLVAVKDGKFLICKRVGRHPHDWWVPGGRVFKNETLLEAIKRKAMEELGATVTIYQSISVYDNIFPETHTPSVTFLVTLHEDEIALDKQHSEYKYVSLAETEGMAVHQVLEDAMPIMKKLDLI